MKTRVRLYHVIIATLLCACWSPAAQAGPVENCRSAVSPSGGAFVQPVRRVVPDNARDRGDLDAWCRAVGPAVVAPAAVLPATSVYDLVVVTWNVHVGAGDIVGLVSQLRAGTLTGGEPVEHFVLLLQEVYRRGTLVPADHAAALHVPHSIVPSRPVDARSMDIVDVANTLGLSLFYAPSMRNGPPSQTDEDRGNAILSTEPLTGFSVIELPLERQRRVALEATIAGRRADGAAWTLSLTDAHLENLGGRRRVGILSLASRLKQVHHLLRTMTASDNVVLGGDLNTWFGFREPAYHALARVFTRDAGRDRRPTFGRLMRLDHLLFRVPDAWNTVTSRLDTLGSDHHPLLARIRLTPAASGSPPAH